MEVVGNLFTILTLALRLVEHHSIASHTCLCSIHNTHPYSCMRGTFASAKEREKSKNSFSLSLAWDFAMDPVHICTVLVTHDIRNVRRGMHLL